MNYESDEAPLVNASNPPTEDAHAGIQAQQKPSSRACKGESQSPAKSPLSGRQEVFCRLYVVGKTATEAYAQAYRCRDRKVAKSAGSRLLTNVNVQRHLSALRGAADTAASMTLRQMRVYLRRVVFTPIGHVDKNSDLCQTWIERKWRGRIRRKGAKAGSKNGINEDWVTIMVRMPDKLKAIELDARLSGEFDRREAKPDADDGLLELLSRIGAGK